MRFSKLSAFWRRWVWPEHRAKWFLCLGLNFTFFIISAVIPFVWGKVTDSLTAANSQLFANWIAWFFLFEGTQVLCIYLKSYFTKKLELQTIGNMQKQLYSRMQTVSYESLLNLQTGDGIHRISNDAASCSPLVVLLFSELAGYIILALIILALMFSLSPVMAAFCLALMGVYGAGFFYYRKKTPEYVNKRQRAQAGFLSAIEEGLDAAYSIRVQGAYPAAMACYERSLGDYIQSSFSYYKFNLLFQGVFSSFVTFAMEAGIVLVGAWLIFRNRLTVGAVISFSLYINWLVQFVSFLSTYTSTMEPALVSLERVEEILAKPAQWAVSHDPAPAAGYQQENGITIRDLNFSFQSKQVFHRLCLNIPSGKVTLIKAESGRGKTTLLNLMLGLYPAGRGCLFIGGKDIATLSAEEILSMISVVEQEPHFFGGSLLESITCADKTGLSQAALIEQANKLGIGDFIEKILDRQTATPKLNELSGGERKRLGILRGFLRNTPIVILDEPTAFLDAASAVNTMNHIRDAYRGKTLIVFSHDSSVDQYADDILTL